MYFPWSHCFYLFVGEARTCAKVAIPAYNVVKRHKLKAFYVPFKPSKARPWPRIGDIRLIQRKHLFHRRYGPGKYVRRHAQMIEPQDVVGLGLQLF